MLLCFTVVGLFVFLDHVLESESRFGVLEKPLQTDKKAQMKEKLKRKQKTVLFSYFLQRLTDKLSDKMLELQQKHEERERECT